MKVVECHEAGCAYPKKPGKQKCEWHWLKKQPMEVQIEHAARRRADMDAAQETHRTLDAYPVARVAPKLWPEGSRFCAGCQDMIPLFYCTSSRCKAHAAEKSHEGALKAKYDIDRGTYLALLELQGGRCYVCRQEPKTIRLAVDHDHATGEVRGLLCAGSERGCNNAVLGSLEARSADGVIAACQRLIEYMTKTPYQQLKEATHAIPEQDPRGDLGTGDASRGPGRDRFEGFLDD